MKIGIITFSQALNYGALLQEYALFRIIGDLGYECEIIDYRNVKFETEYSSKIYGSLKTKIKRIITLKQYWSEKKRAKFAQFEKDNIKKSAKIYYQSDVAEIENAYDFVITGSDQVFNLDLTDSDFIYYLSCVSKGKSMAYAPSFGVQSLPVQWNINSIKSHLLNIRYLSAREYSGADIIKHLTNRNVDVVLDPTLLLNEEIWKSFIGKNKKKDNYLLLYTFEDGAICKYAEKVATDRGLHLVKINANIKDIVKRRLVAKNGVGIEEFLTLINYADVVITNSYHGMIFSFIFDTLFFVFPHLSNKNINARMNDFLGMVGLSDRMVDADSDIPMFNNDISDAKKVVKALKEKSLQFLVDSIIDYGETHGK